MDPLRIYEYLTTSRQRVICAIEALQPHQYSESFGFGLKSIGSTLAHIMISEWYYIERLEQRTVPPYDRWPIKYETPPAFQIIKAAWREQAVEVHKAIANQSDWQRKVTWLSFPDDTRSNKRFYITCTAGDLVAQLAFHEVHHRAQLMVMLRELGHPLEDLDYNALMFHRVEAIE